MPQISASVDAMTIIKINQLAAKENRSFSEMVNLLLQAATKNIKPKKYAIQS